MLHFTLFSLLFVHISIPLLSVIYFDAPPIWLVIALFFCIASILLYRRNFSAVTLVLFSMVSGAWTALNLLLGASYYVQGEGFNDQFFYHLDSGSLAIAARSYSAVFYPTVIAFVLALVLPLFFARNRSRLGLSKTAITMVWVLALVSNYPLWSYAGYILEVSDRPQGSFASNRALTSAEKVYLQKLAEQPGSFRKKNIILIYAESLEHLYFNKKLVKADLLPNLRKLAARSHRFTNLRQVQGASATITGIIASQCGFPVKVGTHLAVNSTISAIDRPYENETCLADILSQNNYQTVFMGGAPLSFAGKGKFLETHGYEQVYGERELTPLLSDTNYRHGWGLYDDSLFDMAREKLLELEGSDQPYLLTLLTLDTHHPKGYLSGSCKRHKELNDQMAQAIYCSDQLISSFILDAMNTVDMEDTVIVLFSDHISMRNSFWNVLRENQKKRRLSFMIFDDSSGGTSKVRGNHFDIAPTVLEAAGLPGTLKVGAGSSLFYLQDQDPDRKSEDITAAPKLLEAEDSARDTGIIVSRENKSIKVGNKTFAASDQGREFEFGMYLVVFDEEGRPQDAIYSGNYTTLANNLQGRFVVGISVFANAPKRPSYFYGRVTWDGEMLVQKGLYGEMEISAEEFRGTQDIQAEMKATKTNSDFPVKRVAHGGGALGKRKVTNSYEALTENLKRGFQYFELDFNFTSDDQIVCIHDWQQSFESTFGVKAAATPSLAIFNDLVDRNNKFKNCTLDGLAQWMRKNPGAYIVTDVKERNLAALKQIVTTLPDAENRVIPQIYEPGNFAKARKMGFKHIILTLYRYKGLNSQLLSQVKSWDGSFAVTMPTGTARSGFGKQLQSLGIPTYAHTVNERPEKEELLSVYGISEIYTDFLAPSSH